MKSVSVCVCTVVSWMLPNLFSQNCPNPYSSGSVCSRLLKHLPHRLFPILCQALRTQINFSNK